MNKISTFLFIIIYMFSAKANCAFLGKKKQWRRRRVTKNYVYSSLKMFLRAMTLIEKLIPHRSWHVKKTF